MNFANLGKALRRTAKRYAFRSLCFAPVARLALRRVPFLDCLRRRESGSLMIVILERPWKSALTCAVVFGVCLIIGRTADGTK